MAPVVAPTDTSARDILLVTVAAPGAFVATRQTIATLDANLNSGSALGNICHRFAILTSRKASMCVLRRRQKHLRKQAFRQMDLAVGAKGSSVKEASEAVVARKGTVAPMLISAHKDGKRIPQRLENDQLY